MAKISIVIPTYNCGQFLIKTLVALEGQNFRDFGVVVVDDGSTDNTQQLLDQYIRLGTTFPIKKIVQEHQGANVARNAGFEQTDGEYVLFLDADKVLASNALETFMETLEDNPDAAYVYSRHKKDGHIHKPGKFNADKLRKGPCIDCCALIRRDKFSGFDPRLRRLQDWDLWLTMLGNGDTGVVVEEVLYETTSRPDDITSSEDLGAATEYIRKKHFGGGVSYFEVVDEEEADGDTAGGRVVSGLVDIIIVRFGAEDMITTDWNCFGALIKNTKYPRWRMKWIDNYEPRRPLGVVWNEVIQESTAPYICLLHNDTRVEEDWLANLMSVFSDGSVGAVGPMLSEGQRVQMSEKRPDGDGFIDFEKEYGKAFQLDSTCLVFPRKAWEEVGGFDKDFDVYYVEKEFLHRVQGAGYRTLCKKDVYVKHIYGVSGEKREEKEEEFDISEARKSARKLYIDKLEEI